MNCPYQEVNMIRISHFAAPAALGAALFLGAQGCSHEHPDAVPASATELSAGTNEVTATAPKDGTVYVYDITANRPLYVGNVNKGDSIRVDAKGDKLFLNDKIITKRDDLRDSHRYKIFFDRSEMDREQQRAIDRARANGQTTIVQPAPAGAVITPDANAEPRTTVVVPQQQQPPANNSGTTVVVPQQQQTQQPANTSGTTVVVPQQQPPQQQPAGGTNVIVTPPPQPAR
jgi:hypothetical protein